VDSGSFHPNAWIDVSFSAIFGVGHTATLQGFTTPNIVIPPVAVAAAATAVLRRTQGGTSNISDVVVAFDESSS
jgi:hypothetical protein